MREKRKLAPGLMTLVKKYQKLNECPKAFEKTFKVVQSIFPGAKIVATSKVWPFPFKATKQAISRVAYIYNCSVDIAQKYSVECERMDRVLCS